MKFRKAGICEQSYTRRKKSTVSPARNQGPGPGAEYGTGQHFTRCVHRPWGVKRHTLLVSTQWTQGFAHSNRRERVCRSY